MYCSFASIGHADIIWSIVSANCWQSLLLLLLLLLLVRPAPLCLRPPANLRYALYICRQFLLTVRRPRYRRLKTILNLIRLLPELCAFKMVMGWKYVEVITDVEIV